MDFNGRTAIITGSSRGIGRALAMKLAQLGAFVVVNGRDVKKVTEVVDEIQLQGGKAIGFAGDVRDPKTADELVKLALEHTGKINILVNNAGIIADKMSYKMSFEDFSHVLDVHVKGTFLCTKAVVNEMRNRQDGGFIINMTSLAGLEGIVGQVNYSAAKAAINGMTWTLAKELKKDRIQVNAISPAALTEMTRPYVEKAKQKVKQGTSSQYEYWEIGTVDDVADFIADLLRVQNLSLSGEIFAVNGKKIGSYSQPLFQEHIK